MQNLKASFHFCVNVSFEKKPGSVSAAWCSHDCVIVTIVTGPGRPSRGQPSHGYAGHILLLSSPHLCSWVPLTPIRLDSIIQVHPHHLRARAHYAEPRKSTLKHPPDSSRGKCHIRLIWPRNCDTECDLMVISAE